MVGKGMRKVGPSGNKSGRVWDHKGNSSIKQLIVSYEPKKIISLQFQCQDDLGNLFMSDNVGNSEFSGSGFCTGKFDLPSEHICLVHGFYNPTGYVEELTISTNKKSYTFGKASNSDEKQWFWYELGELNQFGGFHGTCDSHGLMSIGVYFKPEMTNLVSHMKDLTIGDATTIIESNDA